jgi:hypothetical protein
MSDARCSGLVSSASFSATTRPARITTTRRATSSTSRSLWLMNATAVPFAASSRITRNSSSDSCGVSTDVGSSRINVAGLRAIALINSSFAFSPTESSSTRRETSLSAIPVDAMVAAASRSIVLRVAKRKLEPSARFSAMVNSLTSRKC